MATKTKFKLKNKFKFTIVFTLFLIGLIFLGIKVKNHQEYMTTLEYKILDKGYDLETFKLIEEKLSKENLEYILKEDKYDYLKKIIGEKYYIDEYFHKYLDFYSKNDKKDFKDVVALVNVEATRPWYEDPVVTDTSKNEKILVNKFYKLPDDYSPGTIKTFSKTYAYGEVKAEENCYKAFIEMANAAKKDGITLILTSGYRSSESQKAVYDDFKNKKGIEYADEFAARPGHSEHETGLALDILTYNAYTNTFKETEAYRWLQSHASDYGFIERYKEGLEYMTGYAPESWHYRYVGTEIAKEVESLNITYDEYYAFYIAKNE